MCAVRKAINQARLSAIRTLACCRCLGDEKKETACRQARHQADNLAKLRFESLSVFERIAQILCAVRKAINQARLSAIRTLACCRCLGDEKKETACRQARHQADNLAKLRFESLSVFERIAQILCAVRKAINQARLSAIRTLACCRCLGDDFCLIKTIFMFRLVHF